MLVQPFLPFKTTPMKLRLEQDAQHAVKECIDEYNAMLSQLDDGKKAEVMRSMGMKMEQVEPPARSQSTCLLVLHADGRA